MSAKMRKCDKIKQVLEQPPKACCPICTLPAYEPSRKVGSKTIPGEPSGCEFFARMRDKQFSAHKAESARLRSKTFVMYHADICETCKQPKEECRKKRLAAVKRNLKKTVLCGYATPEELTALVDDQPCQPPDRSKYTPVKPDWYVEEQP